MSGGTLDENLLHMEPGFSWRVEMACRPIASGVRVALLVLALLVIPALGRRRLGSIARGS
jgi:hypothetical protein